MKLTLNQAAKEASVSKSTLSKAIKDGKITAERKGNRLLIEPSELFRVFERKSVSTDRERSASVSGTVSEQANVRELQAEISGLKEVVKAKDETIEELRARIADLQKTQQLLTYYQAPLLERLRRLWYGSKKDSDSSAARSD